MKKILKQIWDYLFEIFIWFIFIWICTLIIALTKIFPDESIKFVTCAVVFTFLPKIYRKFRKTREE